MTDSLTPAQAAPLAGAPEQQLRRWAWEDWDTWERRPMGQVGPLNSGTRRKPAYREEDVVKWKAKACG